MIAKYSGQCAISGQPIVAGETEIAKFGASGWVLAEYADFAAAAAYATQQLESALEIVRQAGHYTDRIEMYIGRMANLGPVRPDMTIMSALREAKESVEIAREDLGN